MCGYSHSRGTGVAARQRSTRTWVVRSSQDLGRAIADLRHQRHLSQAELAGAAGVDRTYLAKLEAGASVLLFDRAVRLLRRLGADVVVQVVDLRDEG